MAIQILPRGVSEKIAAGEVVHRPASAVKELLDNAVDAGANRISIEIERAGRTLIRVTDDGCGIAPDELPLVFEHHATSKVACVNDLLHISTMGFRGEAMPSIAAVSEAAVTSRPTASELGAGIKISFGQPSRVVETGAPVGTTVEVRNLFANLPVRLKFLKSNRTEWGHISAAVTRFATAFPPIAFRLSRNGQETLSLESHKDVPSRLARLYGASLAEQLIASSAEIGGAALKCWVGSPSITRANMDMVQTYVNSRFVRVPGAIRALKDSFGEHVPRGRCPVAFLFITVPPSYVDVNVHPAKEEVRFRNPGLIHDVVRQAVSAALSRAAPRTPPASALRAAVPPTPRPRHPGRPIRRTAPVRERREDYRAAPPAQPQLIDVRAAEVPIRFLQIHNSYIVAEHPDGILLIDQHALHERILLDELTRKASTRTIEKQGLLVPVTVNLTPEESARLPELQDLLHSSGIETEVPGNNTALVRSVPASTRHADPADLLLEAIHNVSPGTDRQSALRDLLGIIACKAAIKAGDSLSDDEARRLLKGLSLPGLAKACAHGRPTHLLLTLSDLEKMFERR